jgi:DNA-binding NtrC family response regulator
MDKNILVVDNEKDILNVLKDVLGILGYSTELVKNGQEALSIFEKDRFSLVITDMVMPDIDGLTLMKKIKEEDPSIPVVIITGFGSQMVDEAMRAGADGFIEKPFKI